jgi:hypothetical protein
LYRQHVYRAGGRQFEFCEHREERIRIQYLLRRFELSTRSLIAIASRLGIDGITLIVYLRIFSLFSPFAFLR